MKLFDSSLVPDKAFFYISEEDQSVPHFCEDLLVLYLLTGNAELKSETGKYTMNPNDFTVINPYERYIMCHAPATVVLILKINSSLLQADLFLLCRCSIRFHPFHSHVSISGV